MANLFDKAKKGAVAKKAETYEVIKLPEIEKDIIELNKLKIEIASSEAKASIRDTNIRLAAKEAMIKFYQSKKKFPGTLKIVAGKGSFMFITSDKYKVIDKDRYNELSEQYGEDMVEETTVYSFNTEILEKHMDHISELIMKSKELSTQEKEDLITSKTTYTVKKGTIKEIFTHTDDVETLIEDIQPVFSIKNVIVE